ncbi:MAG: class II aldolase/adducin family protein, partial [Burkholderiales bacterium]
MPKLNEHALREQICELGRSIFERGLTHGSTGNISARCDDGWLLTPTGSSLGRLDPARLLIFDRDWARAVVALRKVMGDRKEPLRDEAAFWLAHS